jgi:uncharacterized protein YpuA (DUF1002 family)
MGVDFKETSVNKVDLKKFEENYNKIDWGKKKCDCHKFEKQVCDICQGVTGEEKDAGE